jgi:hypothetical protein
MASIAEQQQQRNDMQGTARMRPVLQHEIKAKPTQVKSRLEETLADASCRCTGTLLDKDVQLFVKEDHRHFWSPWFSGKFAKSEDGSCLLEGKFGPHPALWTGFAACYAVLAFCAVGALMYGLSQLTLDRTPWALFLLPAFGVLALGLYVAGLVGKRLAAEQIGWMLRLLDCALDGKVGCDSRECVACPRRLQNAATCIHDDQSIAANEPQQAPASQAPPPSTPPTAAGPVGA